MMRVRPSMRERGQAIAEFAVVLPVVVLVMMLVLQVGGVVFDRIAVTQYAREIARKASVDARPGEAGVPGPPDRLDPARIEARLQAEGVAMRASVRYRAEVRLPFGGPVLVEHPLTAQTVMLTERSERGLH